MASPTAPATGPIIENHAPDSPFGCVAMWGPPIGAFYADMATHVCNEDDDHEGDHVCTCGATATNLGTYSREPDSDGSE